MLSCIVSIKAQQSATYNEPDTVNKNNFDFIEDNFIVAALDSLSALKYFENTESAKSQLYNNKYNFLPNFVPTYPDSVYYYRMQRLDVSSPIELTYNPYVRMFIDLYANKKRGTTSRVLGLAQMYFPMIEQQLDKYNLPLELKYLSIVESALNAKARSRVGAGGLWQFMYYTGRVYGLEVNSYVDDRNDPMKATVAACLHFKDLYNMYHDWLLVLAAYNSGPGNVNKAIRRSGGKMTFWEIMPYLPRETRDYVPAFIAVNYVMAYSNEHNIYPVMPRIVYHETDTVAVTQPINFNLLAEKLKLSADEIEFLNPTFRQRFIPATPANPYYIRLPQRSIADFINNEESLYSYFKLKGFDPAQFASSSQSDVEYETVTKLITHKVRKGETIATIARRYDCSTSEIKRWNKLRKTALKRGQALKIYEQVRRPIAAKAPKSNPDLKAVAATPDSTAEASVNVTKASQPQVIAVKAKYHTVKRGESLGLVASKYGVSVSNLKSWNHLRKNTVMAGQKLRVNAPGTKYAPPTEDYTARVIEKESTPVSINESDSQEDGDIHVVQKGETLGRIATKYGVTTGKLREWNNLDNIIVKPGQKLRITSPNNIEIAQNDEETALAHNDVKPALGATKQHDSIKPDFHIVKKGEYLGRIAAKYGVTTENLREWNNLPDNNVNYGQKLIVSAPSSETAGRMHDRRKDAASDKVKDATKMVYYTVKPGDTLWSISQKYSGVTIDQLKEWNKIKNGNIKVGQRLKVILTV